MASGAAVTLDAAARRAAIDPTRSFTVRAPAGSGKTELLIQRFLALLPTVDRPESILAITFTRKAAGEMRERVMSALRDARQQRPVEKEHERVTRGLASAALEHDSQLGWQLLDHPGRLRIQTIDSLSLAIAGEMPFLSRLGEMPAIEDDTRLLYNEAARLTLLEAAPDFRPALKKLLAHFDNNAAQARGLIAQMLGRRDQWIRLTYSDAAHEREELERTFVTFAEESMARVDQLVPEELKVTWAAAARLAYWPQIEAGEAECWQRLARVVVKSDYKDWFKKLPFSGLAQTDEMRRALYELKYLPPAHYSDDQWDMLEAFLEVLHMSLGQLQLVFRERGAIDFCELNLAAHRALEAAGNPTELAEKMDWRIRHLLVDEFQDTSRTQFDLFEKLISGWELGDGRTLFLVGDPMQSVYRFRQAEVGLFVEVEDKGIGHLRPDSLTLALNYRSPQTLVDRFNAIGEKCFPEASHAELGAISYIPSSAFDKDGITEFTFEAYDVRDTLGEANGVIARIKSARKTDKNGTVAILVRARSHLAAITAALRDAKLPYRAVELDTLDERPVVRDLLALTRALLHREDRISWLAIMRAPWCGLTLADLHALTGEPDPETRRWPRNIWMCLQDLSALSPDGQQRAGRLHSVISEAFAQQGRWTLRRWVERVWLNLGGPACLNTDTSELADAQVFLNLLEREQAGADLRDFDQLPARTAQLFAQSKETGEAWLQVMTIHKAKGLQFDTVVLPGLNRATCTDDSSLIQFDERLSFSGSRLLLLAAKSETGGDDDPHYKYLAHLEHQKTRHEKARLLYVALTRAKKRLHLSANLAHGKDGYGAKTDSLLGGGLFEYLREQKMVEIRPRTGQTSIAFGMAPLLQRLPSGWRLPALPAPVEWTGASVMTQDEPHEPSFEWAGESLRIAGTVVHGFLERMFARQASEPGVADIRAALLHGGISQGDAEATASRVRLALQRTIRSERGRWILAAHSHARKEYAVSGVVDGEIVHGRVDRTFVDEQGVRWIIDFKTSEHEGGGRERFLDEQQRRYNDQLTRYARIFAPLGNPVRLGLYFPLLDAWREWEPQI